MRKMIRKIKHTKALPLWFEVYRKTIGKGRRRVLKVWTKRTRVQPEPIPF